jgi:hypothetical protein
MRTIIEETSFEAAWDLIESSVRRRDEIMLDVCHRLSRCPEEGGVTDGPGIFAIPTREWPGAPEVVIYYKFDAQNVWLLDVILADEDDLDL